MASSQKNSADSLVEAPIAAIATASGPAGVCVVRVSGAGALELGDRLVPGTVLKPSARQTGTFFHTPVLCPGTQELVDDAVVLVYRAPHSYTGEDTLEIQGHGGAVAARRLLEAVLEAGARLAAPGEFTRRAFLNGRMDLTQAEAVCDLITAKTNRAAQAARLQLDGILGRDVAAAYAAMMEICAEVEHFLDFEEGELPPSFMARISERLSDATANMLRLSATGREGQILREGALVVISGRPNAGKSSLLNALLGHARAIVHDQPGTTRDVIEECYALNGVPLRLVDTAGLRDDSPDAVEREGVGRARGLIARADVNIHVVDAALAADELAAAEMAALPASKTLIAFSKSDLPQFALPPVPAGLNAVRVSAKSGAGLDSLKAALSRLLEFNVSGDGHAAVSQRHAAELREAVTQAHAAVSVLGQPAPDLAVAASHLRSAAEALGRITGRVYTDDLLDTVFSRFCVGK